MARLYSSRNRSFDMGVLPTELLARDPDAPIVDSRMPGERDPAGEQSIAPVDTHLFLNGSAPEAEMPALLAMGAGTCYLHATLVRRSTRL